MPDYDDTSVTYVSALGAAALQKAHDMPSAAAVAAYRTQVINPASLYNFQDQIIKLDNFENDNFAGITGYGDSMADADLWVMRDFAISLQSRFGLGAVFTPQFGQSGLGSSWAFTGGATQSINDFTYLPSACQVVLPAGATATNTTKYIGYTGSETQSGSYPQEAENQGKEGITTGFKKARCFYLTRPSDGTLTITISQENTPAYTPVVIDCNNTLGLSFVDVDITNQSEAVTISLSSAGAECIFIGAAFYRTKGVMVLKSNVGGSTMAQQNAYIDAGNEGIYSQLCQDLGIRLFVHAQRAGDDAAYQANYVKVFDSIDLIPNSCNLILGEPPRVTELAEDVANVNSYLETLAISRGYAFFDQNKAVGGSYANLVALGWEGDGVHSIHPASRYFSGLILAGINWFSVGVNRLNIDPLTMAKYLDKIVHIGAAQDAQTSTISAREGATIDNLSTSGGFTYTASNLYGFTFNGAAALGGVTGVLGPVALTLRVSPQKRSYATTLSGYRNLLLKAGVRAFFLIGTQGAVSSLSSLTDKCYGFECALGVDVGSPDGEGGEVIRLLASNGATVSYGEWVSARHPAARVTSQGGLNVSVVWNKSSGNLELYRSSEANRFIVSTLKFDFFTTNECSGAFINAGLVAEDGTNVPVEGGTRFNINEVKTRFNTEIQGLVNNGF